MDLVKRLVVFTSAAAALVSAEGFTFTIGPAVASGDFAFKGAAFVVRVDGCNDPDKPQIAASAEGFVKDARKTVLVKVMPTAKPNVYAIPQTWPEGTWVVNLRGTCGKANAGAIIPIGPKGFIRESAKFFSRPATDAEVDASLKALVQGANK
jgi:hypothetical protein